MVPSEMNDSDIQATEEALARLFAAPEPDREFLRALRERLLAEAEREGAAEPVRPLSAPRRLWELGAGLGSFLERHAWVPAALALLLVLALAVALGGPARVLAELGRLPGYFFGIGFVDLTDTRALPAPVSVTREGVTLTVEQVLAQRDRTVVRIRAEGLPPLADESLAEGDPSFRLRLPDGSTLAPTGWRARRGEATVDFPPLPGDVYRVDLLVERLPIVLPGTAPENWKVALGLHPTSGEMIVAGYTAPYTPEDAADSHHGVTLRLLEVAQGPESTALNLEVSWPDPEWRFPRLGYERSATLRDDLGHVYCEGAGPSAASLTAERQVVVAVERHAIELGAAAVPTPQPGSETCTLTFGPVSPAASRLMLAVDSIAFNVPLEAEFTLDLGDDPQLGQEWPLDVWLDVAGLLLHVTGARLQQNDYEGEDEPPVALALFTDPFPRTDDRSLVEVSFSAAAEGYRGTRGNFDPRTRIPRTSLLFDTVPRGTITIEAGGPGFGAQVSVHGPWEITWAVPGGPPVPMEPMSLRPDASQGHGGLTLRVERVDLTDRLTAVTLDMEPGPEGETLVGASARLPGSDRLDHYHLTDERGNRYEAGVALAWEPFDGPAFDPHRLLFQPLAPLAGRVTFHAPAIVVMRPAAAAFEVTVPEGAEEGEPWSVDVALSVGGYPLRFTEARLQYQLLVLSAELREHAERDGRLLAGLSLRSVTGPDGVERPLATDAALVEQFGQVVTPEGAGERLLLVGFSAGAGGGPIGPGTYRVQVAGVNEAVPGPWELTWEMPQ